MGFRVSFMRLPAIVSLWKLLFDGDLQFYYFIVNHKKLQIQSDRLIEIGTALRIIWIIVPDAGDARPPARIMQSIL
jgi:hypothetical protein